MKNIVYNMDCMKGMAQIPDKWFDLAIVDPPYGIGICAPGKRSLGHRKGQRKLTQYKSATWDNAIPDSSYFKELLEFLKIRLFGVEITLPNTFTHQQLG